MAQKYDIAKAQLRSGRLDVQDEIDRLLQKRRRETRSPLARSPLDSTLFDLALRAHRLDMALDKYSRAPRTGGGAG